MVEGPKFSLVNLEGLSEPATKLVEVVSAAIGTIYAPFGTVRQAKADAKATIIRAEADTEAASLAERASSRIAFREALRQQHVEEIVSLAAQELPEQVSDTPVDPDWTLQYIDSAQDVSDQEMQTLWARILAEEVASPGSYSKRTLSFLRTLEKWEAQAFTSICRLALQDNQGRYFLLHSGAYAELYRQQFGIEDTEGHLTSIGLIRPDEGAWGPATVYHSYVSYFGQKYEIIAPDDWVFYASLHESAPDSLTVRLFSGIGQELARISGATPIENYMTNMTELADGILMIPITPTATR